jgi:hypothetical protein
VLELGPKRGDCVEAYGRRVHAGLPHAPGTAVAVGAHRAAGSDRVGSICPHTPNSPLN